MLIFSKFQKITWAKSISFKLVVLIIGFLTLTEILVLILTLPLFHTVKMESRMRELVFLAELKLIKEKGNDNATPIPCECGIGILTPDGTQVWFGSEEIINRSKNVTPEVWDNGFSHQLGLAIKSVFKITNEPVIYRVNTNNLMQTDVHTHLKSSQYIDLIMPADILSGLIWAQLGKGLGLIMFISILMGVLVMRFVNGSIIVPIERLIDDMTAFAENPYHLRGGMIYSKDDGIVSDAQKALDGLQRSTRQELVQRDKLASIGEAVAKVNHDIRNILASAMLVLDFLEQSEDPKIKSSSRVVRRAIERGVRLCTQMLTFIKSPENIRPEKSIITLLIEECAEEIGISIHYSGPDELVVDNDYFFRLIHNIVNNAQRAGASEVNIEIWKAGSYAVMDISDNGQGIPAEIKNLLFKPFAGSSRGSLGLGLCISRDIAIAHGGDLRLKRSNKRGSTFRVCLPVEVLG